MIYREVLTSIPEDDFMLAGDRTFESLSALNKISPIERKLATAEFHALAGLSHVVQLNKLLAFRPNYGSQLGVGITRFCLALKEYFDGLESEGELDDQAAATRKWLQNLDRKRLYSIMHSYLYQESVEAHLNNAGNDEIEGITLEEERTIEEYPAFSAFADLLEERLLDDCVEDDEALNVSSGVLLGAIAIREEVELQQLYKQLSYVAYGA